MKDADVRRCSLFARGLLVDLLCLCFDSKRRGVLCEADGVTPWSNDDIVNALTGGSREQLLAALEEIERKGVLSRDENGCLYSRRMVRDEEIRIERAKAGSAGGKQNRSKQASKIEANTKQSPEEEDEEEDEEEVLDPGKTNRKFIPPTVEEVKAYCAERENDVDAEAFVAFYDSKGWLVGDQKMKRWQSAVVTWEKRPQRQTSTNAVRRAPAPDI